MKHKLLSTATMNCLLILFFIMITGNISAQNIIPGREFGSKKEITGYQDGGNLEFAVSDLSINTTLIGRWLHGSFNSVFVNDTVAFVGNDNFLMILNIKNLSNPTVITSIEFQSEVKSISLFEDYLYIANDIGGLQIVDVSNLSSVRITGFLNTGGNAVDVESTDGYVYLADGSNGLTTVLVVDPENPAILGRVEVDNAVGISIKDNYAFIADESFGLRIFNITSAISPFEIGGGVNTGIKTTDVYVSGNYAYVSDAYDGLKIIDITDPTAPEEIGSYRINSYTRSVFVKDNFAFFAEGYINNGGLTVLDVSDPANPAPAGSYISAGVSRQVHVFGQYAFLADDRNGIEIIDINDPHNPFKLSGYDTGDYAYDVLVSDNYAYLADGKAGLKIIDVRIASEPFEVGAYNTTGTALRVYKNEEILYVADGDSGLVVIDVGIPENPVKIGEFDTDGTANDVFISGNYAFIADGKEGMQILDVTDPSLPVFVSNYENPLTGAPGDTNGAAYGVYVSGSYAFLAYTIDGLRIVDISDIHNPELVTIFDPGLYGSDVYVRGNNVYITDFWSKLHAINIDDILHPRMLEKIYTYGFGHGSAYGLYGHGDYLYVASGLGGVRMFDISDSNIVEEIGFYTTYDEARGVSAQENFIYVAYGAAGLYIIRNDLSLLSFSHEVLDFGEVGLGESETWNTFTFRTNLKKLVGINEISIDHSDFQASGYMLPMLIQPLHVVNIIVEFSPSTIGPVESLLKIYTDLADMPVKEIVLKGYGVSVTGIDDESNPKIPVMFDLLQNYPNPFNSGTTIKFDLPALSMVNISVYDILGRKIKDLVYSENPAGRHFIFWDGTDQSGMEVSSGIYFTKMNAGKFSKTNKMLILK